ncbi:FtsX-like permease family protein [Paenibacillus sp. OV219]|uniref:FtsX-like permease family protein n=1 Tax=Paenibacillus sp. OV219 TaxID=1884377 RepID=UPI0008BA90A8|nr:ABC transporter permease [Paenibacillus sp. OV219]SEO82222.1 FtsX-like permease family protein [Paenibacillus sp. OV219]
MNLTFRHIVNQNLKFNFKRFISYLFVNGFVVAVLFMYGSLLYNKVLAEDASTKLMMDYIGICTYAIILFSVVFVAYTGIYFVKSRGKEFSVYLTLGMTRRDLIRMIYVESLVIVAGSAVSGIALGLLLSKLFYLILGRILGLSTSIYFISGKTYLLSLGVFGGVFLCNMLFTSVFIRRLSIIQIGKAGSTKGLAKTRPIIGFLSIIATVVAMYTFDAVSTGDTLFGYTIEAQYRSPLIVGSIFTVFVALYFVIPTCMDVVRLVMGMFPSLYNRNLLIMTNLKHRFVAYKVSLYIVSLLICCAIMSMGFGLSFYSYTHKTIGQNLPYDFMIESGGGINKVSEAEVKQIVASSGGELSDYSSLPYIYDENYRDYGTRFNHDYTDTIVISESNFNRHTGLSVDVKPDELLLVYNQNSYAETSVDYNTIMTIEPWRQGSERANAFEANQISKEAFLQSLGKSSAVKLEFQREKTHAMVEHFINSYGDVEFEGVMANVVDDSVYAKLAPHVAEYTAHQFNLKRGDGEKVFASILDALRASNHADSSLWASTDTQFGNKDQAEALRPIYKKERYDIAFKINGLLFFSLGFLGMLFLLSSSVVLYYKMVTDVDEEKEQIALLKRIGLTVAECKSYLQMHLAVVFFAPLVIGGILGIYFLSFAWSGANMAWFLFGRVGLMYGAFALLDVLFYMALRKKFFRSVRI